MKKIVFTLFLLLLEITSSAQTDSTLFMKHLCQLNGVSNVTKINSSIYPEKYVFKIKQNVDGENDAKGTFNQRVIVGYRGEDRPTILVTEGYFANYALNPKYEEELAGLFNANLIVVEYRYFAESVPVHTNWDYMTVYNSLRDYHNIRQELGKIFKKKWISTGISKGGQTTMFYRATYPNDVDISVSYVAPLNKSVEDGRHEIFLSKLVGTKAERKAIKEAQKEFMRRKVRCMPYFKEYNQKNKLKYYLSEEDIYDYTVLEYPFAFWQWGNPISDIPSKDATDKQWFDYLMNIAGPDYFSAPNKFMPFDVQAARELGYYGYDTKPIKKWMSIKDTKGYLKKIMLPDSLRNIEFNPTLYNRTVEYLKKEDPKHIFIYGETDPWSASGVCTWLDCSKKKNMRIYVQPRGSHKARINNMPSDIKNEIIERISNWLK
ncbi:MAG: aminopeptidase [Bacteroidaceae bacterium]|nr:aminopeptidase [Bacteroidaceae bacterium]